MASPQEARQRYHHGNLAEALVLSGLDLAREGGPAAVVVREASRRVGVSHNAAYRHFPDRDALLQAVCARSAAELAGLMEKAIAAVRPSGDDAEDARRRLNATGRAYIHFAVSEPGLFRTAFSVPEHVDVESRELPGGPGPYEILQRQLDELTHTGGLTRSQREGAETTAWSAVHGLGSLLLDGPLRTLPRAEQEAAIERLLTTISKGLAAE